MSDTAHIERVITDWLHADVTSIGADRVLAASLDRVATAPQDRPRLGRLAAMHAHGKIEKSATARVTLAAGFAAVIVAVVIAVAPSMITRGPASSPAASRITATPYGMWPSPWPDQMVPGAYGALVGEIPLMFRVPDNGWWRGSDADSLYVRDDPGGGWLRFWQPNLVYADPCAHTLQTSIGPRAADLANAMAAIARVRASAVTDVVVGGLPAKHLWLTLPEDAGCATNDFYLWRSIADDPNESGIRRPRLAESRVEVWILDINDDRIVIDSDVGHTRHEGAVAIEDMVASLRLTPISREALGYVRSVAEVCSQARDRLSNDRAVVGGFRSYPPEFADIGAAAAHADAASRILGDALQKLRDLPPPPDVLAPGIDEAYRLMSGTIASLDDVARAARAGDEGAVGSRLVDAYLLTHRSVAAADPAPALWLLDPALAGCSLPSAGG